MSSSEYCFGFFVDDEIARNYADEAEEVISGISEVASIIGLKSVINHGVGRSSEDVTRLFEYFKMPNGKIDVRLMHDSLKSEGLADCKNSRVLLTSSELRTRNINFSFGVVFTDIGLCVQSLNKFIKFKQHDRLAVARHIGRHTLGHILGLNSDTIKSQGVKNGKHTGHCLNECIMRQTDSALDTIKLAKTLLQNELAGFCLDCVGIMVDKNNNVSPK